MNKSKIAQAIKEVDQTVNPPVTEADQKVENTAIEKQSSLIAQLIVSSSKDDTKNLGQAIIKTAKNHSDLQAEMIAAYPRLVDEMTVKRLEEMGFSNLGKSSPSFDLDTQFSCPEMDQINQLLGKTDTPLLGAGLNKS